MRSAWNQRTAEKKKDANFLLLFVVFFIVSFTYFNLPQTLFGENGEKQDAGSSNYLQNQNGENGIFLSYADNFSRNTRNISFTECNSIAVNGSPYFTKTQVLATSVGVSENRESIISYKAEKEDTLQSVADMFNISTDTIRWANDLDNDRIKEGDEILILPVTGVIYYVERGDTIGSIARMHKAKADDIISFNNIDETKIIPGDRLIIPGGTLPPPPPPPSPSRTTTQRTPSQTPSPPVASGNFINPVPGGMITQSTHHYNAVDIYNPCGRPIVAAASGRVTEVARGTWPAGNFVKIDHGTVVILYAHMQSIYVTPGQHVSQGAQIGTVGNTGRTIGRTGCHLHFDVLSRTIRNPFSHLPTGTRL